MGWVGLGCEGGRWGSKQAEYRVLVCRQAGCQARGRVRCGWDRHEAMVMMAVVGGQGGGDCVWSGQNRLEMGWASWVQAAYVTSQDPCHTPDRLKWSNGGARLLYQTSKREAEIGIKRWTSDQSLTARSWEW